MASAIALTVAVPGVRQSLLEGDLEGAADEVFDTIDGIDNFSVKAATGGTVIATDAVAHFPVVGSVVPGTLEFIGTLTAVLLLERYLLVGEDKFEDDFEALGDSLPSELPKSVDELIELFSPIGTSVKKATDAVSEINPEEVSEAAADVFIACVPLEGMERIDGAMFGERGGPAGTSHWMVLVRHAGDEHAAVYDFLPKTPKSPFTAAKLLSGNSVEGVVRSRRLAGVPGRRCCRVGGTRAGLGGRIAIEAAIAAFHERWDADALRLGTNDCRNHSVELARWLTCDYGYGIEVSSDAKGTLTCRRTATPATEEEDEDEGSVEIVPVDVERVSRDVATNASSKDRKNKKQKKKKSSGGPR